MNGIKTTSMLPTPPSRKSSHRNIIYTILCSLVCNENTTTEQAWKMSVNTWVNTVKHTKYTPSEIQANHSEFLLTFITQHSSKLYHQICYKVHIPPLCHFHSQGTISNSERPYKKKILTMSLILLLHTHTTGSNLLHTT
jgi:hypothetical protein